MAEAAAAPVAPSAAPAPGVPTSGTNVPDSGMPSPVSEAPERDTVTRLAKPLKPIPRLPGVFPDDDPFPSPPPSRADSPSPSGESLAGPPRGPDGRFVAGTSPAAAGSGEHTLEPASAEPAPGPFEFGGEKFASRAEAEQNFKSLRGQYKPVQSLARSLGGVDQIVPKFSQAAESARGWKARADALEAELNASRSGAQPEASTPPATEAPADVDWELYAEVKKLATESGEPWKAEQWLIEQVRKIDSDRLAKMLDERDAPFKAQQAKEAVASHTETLFSSLAGYTNADGSVAYPELHDETAAYEIGRMWASLGLPPESALTPQGAIAAIGLYRMARPNGSQAGSAPPTPPVPPSPSAPTDAISAAALSEGRPTVASVGGDGSPSAEAARILAGLRAVNKNSRSATLGFDA